MKKLVYVFVALFAMGMASCDALFNGEKVAEDTTVQDTAVVDSVVADSVVVDSVAE